MKTIEETMAHFESELGKLSHRVTQIEICQHWMRGAWATLTAVYACLFRAVCGK